MVVDIAVDGRDSVYAFAKSSSEQYDIILMDIRMPVMDGCEATRAIRALNRPDAQTIPNYSDDHRPFAVYVRRCLDEGRNGHIAQPIDPEALFVVMLRVINCMKARN